MIENSSQTWLVDNQQYLTQAVEMVYRVITHNGHRSDDPGERIHSGEVDEHARLAIRGTMNVPPALESLCAIFHLSGFEKNVLLWCAAIELDARFTFGHADPSGKPSLPHPTFAGSITYFPGPHWSALHPSAPLRYWKLIEVGSGEMFTQSPLHIDERILHYLTGVDTIDERLRGIIEPWMDSSLLVESHQQVVRRIITLWMNSKSNTSLPIVSLVGEDEGAMRSLASTACREAGVRLFVMRVADGPTAPLERDSLVRLWQRESFLTDRKSTRLNSSHLKLSRMPSSA